MEVKPSDGSSEHSCRSPQDLMKLEKSREQRASSARVPDTRHELHADGSFSVFVVGVFLGIFGFMSKLYAGIIRGEFVQKVSLHCMVKRTGQSFDHIEHLWPVLLFIKQNLYKKGGIKQ